MVVREAKDAQGQPQPKLEIRGEFLHLFMARERIRSHKPVTLQRGADVFASDSLDYDILERVLQMQGRVRGTLAPRAK